MKAGSLGLKSAAIYSGISFLAALIFFTITWLGNYNWLTRIGGAGWVFLLFMIILMPIVTPIVKKKAAKI